MLHDVTIEVFDPGRGAFREVVTLDADGGDDAASKGAIRAVDIAAGRAWKIVGIPPSGGASAPAAGVEGEDYPDDRAVPDELEPAKRGPGRPRKEA